MWLVEDEHMVHTETYRSPEGMETEISIRFGSSNLFGGRQRYKWKRGWFCAYIAMKDADFDAISGRLTFDGNFSRLDVHGGVTYFDRKPPFDAYSRKPGYTTIGWDYNHDMPDERFITYRSVLREARRTARYLSKLYADAVASARADPDAPVNPNHRFRMAYAMRRIRLLHVGHRKPLNPLQ